MKSFILILTALLVQLNLCGQQYYLWNTVNIEGDNYELYTLSSNNHYNQSLTNNGAYNDVLGITAKKNGTYIQNLELIKLLAFKSEQILNSNENPEFITQEWIGDNDVFHYSTSEIPGGVWMPTGSFDGTVDPDFFDYIIFHAINGCTTVGLDDYILPLNENAKY